jgi:hypothetical protein
MMASSRRLGTAVPASVGVLMLAASFSAGAGEDVELVSLGERQIFLKPGQHGLSYFPDEVICVLNRNPLTFTMVCGKDTFLLHSTGSWQEATPVGKVLSPSSDSYDNGYAGIGGIYSVAGSGRLLALYHAEDQKDLPPIGGGVPGFYASVCLATSDDNGRTFAKVGPVITGSLPKNPAGPPAQGAGDVTVTPSHDGQYLYAYYTDHSRVDNRGVQICLARCRIEDGGKPGSWKKYHQGEFAEPGLGGKDTPVVSMQARGGDAWGPQIVFLKESRKYLMTFSVVIYAELERKKAEQSGIYVACSSDGIRWSQPRQLVSAISLPIPDLEVALHSTLVVSAADESKVQGTLLYAYSPKWGHTETQPSHHLAGQTITLKVSVTEK